MKNLTKILQKEIFPISLILLLAFSRLLPHPPNFTPIIAVAIMSGYFFKNIKLSFDTANFPVTKGNCLFLLNIYDL